uniref:uncharacterized protein LOC101297572 n=1 Tax=Fragaria vesca subsp. vesca TaxID=101020 RepID=UPI0005C8DC87
LDFRKKLTTQVFILCDKPKDANLILISFRGRDPLYVDDWSTDIDYSWYENSIFGRLNMGFLEALGLGKRTTPVTFHNHLQIRDRYKVPLEGTEASSSNSEVAITTPNENFPTETIAVSAYYTVRTKLKSLLEDHQNAKFAVTGHSLGGALASLFISVLVLHGEMNVIQRLLGVYTFAQPRIGDYQLGRYIEPHLNNPVPKYFRVVYCNDFLPRLPYDKRNCFYKHFGVCLYYDSRYIEQVMEEEQPNRNYFGMRHLMAHILNAAWELMRSLTMGNIYGPAYAEGWLSILVRTNGLVFPRMSAHLLSDYINSVRIGKEGIIQVSSS